MPKRLTMKELQDSIQIIKVDILEIQGSISRIDDNITSIRKGLSDLQGLVDHYLKRTGAWYDEQIILKARHNQLSGVLVKKNIVTHDETLI